MKHVKEIEATESNEIERERKKSKEREKGTDR